MNTIMKRASAILLIILMVLLMMPGVYADEEPEEKPAVTFSIGIENLPVTIKYGDKTEDGKTDADGKVKFEELYEYVESSEDPVKVTYEVNLPGLAPKTKDREGGDHKYKDETGEITIQKTEGENYYKDEISLPKPDKENFATGRVTLNGKPVSNVKVTADTGDGTRITGTSEDGEFSFEPELRPKDVKYIIISGTDDYEAYKEPYSENVELSERSSASANDFTFDNSVKNGYIKTPKDKTTVTITGKDGVKLSKERQGEFTDSLDVTVNADGTTDNVYVMKDGKVSKPISGFIKFDDSTPTISGLDAKPANGETHFKSHGIYAQKDASINVTITAEDTQSGLDKVTFWGENGKNKTVYEPTSVEGDQYTYTIKAKDGFIRQTLKVRVSDKLGNTTERLLVKDNTEASTLLFDSEAPEISKINVTGSQQNGWFNEAPTISVTAQDKDSGLDSASLELSGYGKILDQNYENVVKEQQGYGYTLKDGEIAALAQKDGTYTVKFSATDNAGNISEEEKSFKIDTVKPNVSLTGMEDGRFYKQAVPVTVKSDDLNAEVEGAYIRVDITKDGKDYASKIYREASEATVSPDTMPGDGEYSLTAYAVDPAGNQSEVKSLSFTIDNTAPQVDVKGASIKANENKWYNKPFTYEFSATDGTAGIDNIKATVNGTPVAAEDGKVEITQDIIDKLGIGKGEYVLDITATDKSGNETKVEELFNIDTAAPKVSISGIDDGAYLKGPAPISFKSDDLNADTEGSFIQVNVKKDGKDTAEKTYNSGEATLDQSLISQDGKYEVTATATDAAGNISETKSISFTIDGTAPELKINGPQGAEMNENKWFNEPFTYTFDASDATSGIQSITASVNGTSVPVNDNTVNISQDVIDRLKEGKGSYTVKVTVTDKSGNATEHEDTYNIDTVAPNVAISGIEKDADLQTPQPLTFTSDDLNAETDGAYMEATVIRHAKNGDVKTTQKYDKAANATLDTNLIQKDGRYTVTLTGYDAAGNKSEEKSVSFTIDNTKPTITPNAKIEDADISANGWYNKPFTYEFTVKDVNDTDATSGIKDVTATINGQNAKLDEVSSKPETIDGKTVTVEKVYRIHVTQNIIDTLIKGKGTYKIIVNAKDNAGNEASNDGEFLIDTIKPNVAIHGVDNKAYYKHAGTITFTSDDVNAETKGGYMDVSIQKNGKAYRNQKYDEASKATLASNIVAQDGKYTIKLTGHDPAGNVSEPKSVTFTVDHTKPVMKVQGVTDAKATRYGWYNKSLTYRFKVSDATSGLDSVKATVNGKPIAIRDGTLHFTNAVIRNYANEKGTYHIVIKAKDKSGNVTTHKKTIKIDNSTPNLKVSGIERDKHYQKNPTLHILNGDKYYWANGSVITVRTIRDGSVEATRHYTKENKVDTSAFDADGDYTLKVSAEDAAGNKSKTHTVEFTKDSTAPKVSVTGGTPKEHYNKARAMRVTVNERYYKTNKVHIRLIRRLDGKTYNEAFPWGNTGKTSESSKTLTKTGTYTLTAYAVDEAGNRSQEDSLTFTVDTEKPKVEISGVKEGQIFTYKDVVSPSVHYSDDYLRGHEWTLTKGHKDWKKHVKFSDRGGRLTIQNFDKLKHNEGVYQLTFSAKDASGNVTKKSVRFAVNRYGSYFKYPESIEDVEGRYMKNVPSDLEISEYNVSKLKKTTNEVTLDGATVSSDNKYTEGKKNGAYNEYVHTFGKDLFKSEGVYSINVLSQDKAGNKMESQDENGKVRFVIDRTKPTITVDGLDERIIRAQNVAAKADVTDNLSDVNITVKNGDKELFSGTAASAKFEIPKGLNQNIEITATDKAGNKTVWTKKVSVVQNGFLYFIIKNWIPLVVLLALVAAGIIWFVLKDKDGRHTKKEEAEE